MTPRASRACGGARSARRPSQIRVQPPSRPGQAGFSAEAPNRLWVSDLTYVATWSGFAYVCFITMPSPA